MNSPARRALYAASIFGICDGMLSILGVVFAARSHPELVPWLATVGGVGAGASMTVGRHLSEEICTSTPADLALGAATFVGSVLPALPYLVLRGAGAIVATGGICLVLAVIVARLRAKGSPRRGAAALGLLAAVFALTLGCALLAPTGGA